MDSAYASSIIAFLRPIYAILDGKASDIIDIYVYIIRDANANLAILLSIMSWTWTNIHFNMWFIHQNIRNKSWVIELFV